jgi:hypothetical protein
VLALIFRIFEINGVAKGEIETKTQKLGQLMLKINRGEPCTKDSTAATMNIPGEGPFINNKTNWLAIQRQLTHLERQQTSLMNMLQVSLSLFLWNV